MLRDVEFKLIGINLSIHRDSDKELVKEIMAQQGFGTPSYQYFGEIDMETPGWQIQYSLKRRLTEKNLKEIFRAIQAIKKRVDMPGGFIISSEPYSASISAELKIDGRRIVSGTFISAMSGNFMELLNEAKQEVNAWFKNHCRISLAMRELEKLIT